MNWRTWQDVEKILVDANIKPLLAVVPSNLDPQLNVGASEARFWDIVRSWQAREWTIGLHGYQHLYVTRDHGLVGLNDRSEFAGLPIKAQAEKLKRAINIFEAEAVRPEVWIAPA